MSSLSHAHKWLRLFAIAALAAAFIPAASRAAPTVGAKPAAMLQPGWIDCDLADVAPHESLKTSPRVRHDAIVWCSVSGHAAGPQKILANSFGTPRLSGYIFAETRLDRIAQAQAQAAASLSGRPSHTATDHQAVIAPGSLGGAFALPTLWVIGIFGLTGSRAGVRHGRHRAQKPADQAGRSGCARTNDFDGRRGRWQTTAPRATEIVRAQTEMERRTTMHRLSPYLPSGTPDSTTGHQPLVTGHRSRRLQLALVVSLALLAPRAFARPYEVLYDANVDGVFPEDVGWERWTTAGGADRTLADGALTLDGSASNLISDVYVWNAMESLNPDFGEMFFAEWRMRLFPGADSTDVGVFIFPDGMERAFHLQYAVNGVGSAWDSRVEFVDTTVFRTYRLESLDMVDYVFYIDGNLAWQGFFGLGTTRSSEISWGDQSIGGASSSEWDYFKFGVGPEPSAALPLALALVITRRRRRLAFRANYKEDKTCTASQHFW